MCHVLDVYDLERCICEWDETNKTVLIRLALLRQFGTIITLKMAFLEKNNIRQVYIRQFGKVFENDFTQWDGMVHRETK